MFLVKREENINVTACIMYTMYIHIHIYHTNVCLCVYKVLTPSLQCRIIAKIDPRNTKLDVVLHRVELYSSAAR